MEEARAFCRAEILAAAYAAHPERFVRKPLLPPVVPSAAWINEPEERKEVDQKFRPEGVSKSLTGSVGDFRVRTIPMGGPKKPHAV